MHAQTCVSTAIIEARLRQAGCFTKPVQGLDAGPGQLHITEMPTEGLEQVGKNCWRDWRGKKELIFNFPEWFGEQSNWSPSDQGKVCWA